MDGKLKEADLALTFDCGLKDQFIDVNRELHRRLIANETPHDYTERPGVHGWPYWENSLPYHALFFHNVFKNNGTGRPPSLPTRRTSETGCRSRSAPSRGS
jgi:S-formylglutathione hydrolase FrmB